MWSSHSLSIAVRSATALGDAAGVAVPDACARTPAAASTARKIVRVRVMLYLLR
jgi:hypothetical protein